MGTAAEFFDEITRTPAYRSALRLLMSEGTWVEPQAFRELEHSPVAMDDALSDLVMLGVATYQPAAGYRLARPALQRAAVKRLLDSGGTHEVLARVVSNMVEAAVAMRDEQGEVVSASVNLPIPAVLSPEGAAQWAADSVCGVFGRGAGHG